MEDGSTLDLTFYRIDFLPNFSNCILIIADPKDNTIYYNPKTREFIKYVNPDTNAEKYLELKREIIIGNFLYNLDSQHFVKPLGYIEFESYKGLVTERINGWSLLNFIKLCTPEQFREVLLRILCLLEKYNILYDFTHHDLHLNNIFISSDLYPILLDFGSSHIKIDSLQIGKAGSKSFLIGDIFRLLKAVKFVTRLEYQYIYDILLCYLKEDSLQLFGTIEAFEEFSNLTFFSVEDFYKKMYKYMGVIEAFDQKHKQNVWNEIEFYQVITNKKAENMKRMGEFCEKALKCLGLKENVINHYDYVLMYSDEYNNLDMKLAINKIEGLSID